MDPSDIISTPFPLLILCKFIAFSLVWNLIVAFVCRITMEKAQSHGDGHQSGVLRVSLMVGLSTIVIHFIIFLCGVHPTMFPLHTLVSAFFLSFNMLLPVTILFPPVNYTTSQQEPTVNGVIFHLREVSNYLFGPTLSNEQTKKQQKHKQQRDQQRIIQHIHQFSALGTVIGLIACSILRVLDHGMQVQRYPVPIVAGATWGSCGGVLIGTITAMAMLGSSWCGTL